MAPRYLFPIALLVHTALSSHDSLALHAAGLVAAPDALHGPDVPLVMDQRVKRQFGTVSVADIACPLDITDPKSWQSSVASFFLDSFLASNGTSESIPCYAPIRPLACGH